jgi:hypothetical protein
MRPGQNKRMRGRNNRKGPNPLTRSYESNGPDVKIRGTAHHVAEKYLQLARDAQSSGDPVMAESYLQHAEHYFRLIAAAQLAQQQAQMGYMRPPGEPEPEDDEDDDAGGLPDRFASPLDRFSQQQQHPQFNPQQQFNQPQPYAQQQPPIQPFMDRGGQGQERQFQDRGDRQPRQDRHFQDRGERQQRQDRPYQDRHGQGRFNRGQQEGRPQRDFRGDQPVPPQQGNSEPAGLPSFITSPVRVPVSSVEPISQPAAADEPAVDNGEGAGFHLRSRRRRRNRGEPGSDGVDTGPVQGEVPVGE